METPGFPVRRLARLAGLTAALAIGLGGCAPPAPVDPGDRRLEVAEALGAGTVDVDSCGEAMRVALDAEALVCIERSWRRSRLTTAGGGWRFELPAGAVGRVDLSLAALEAKGGTESDGTTWRVEVLGDGGLGDVLAERSGSASPAGGWRSEGLELPPDAAALRLTSDGPVAWAEAHLDAGGEAPDDAPPSLVLVILDTLRADSLGVYGYGRATSPELEQLSRDAWLFPHSLSVSTCTQPSTSSLLSGLTPLRHGVRAGQVLPEAADTFVEQLRAAGYRTAAITDGGFVAPNWGFAQGFDRYDATSGDSWRVKDVEPIVDSAVRWLEQNRHQPFFLLVHTYETHMPYTDPEGFAADYLDPDYRGPYEEKAVIALADLPSLVDADRRRLRNLYDGEVKRADHYVGQLLDALESLGLYDRVGLLLTSDHGEEFFEYGSVEHGFGRVYDPHVRVPMLLKPPGAAGDGGRRACPASGLDVGPTLLDLAGLEPPADWLGRSLLDCGQSPPSSDAAPRPILAHGLSAFPKSTGIERFRLDRGERSAFFDRQTGQLRAFELGPDGTLGALLDEIDEPARLAFEHLQGLLAWSSGAPYLVRLEVGDGELVIPEDSRLDPLGLYDGLRRVDLGQTGADGAVRLPVATVGAVYLLTDIGPGDGFTLAHEDSAGDRRELTVTTRTAAGDPLAWRPLGDDLPPFGVLFEGAPPLAAEPRQMTAEEEAELRSLGYL